MYLPSYDVQAALAFFLLRPPAKALWLLLPGPWGRAERLLWRYSSWRQRLRLYTRHSLVVRGPEDGSYSSAYEWRLSRAWWRGVGVSSCVHRRQRGAWIWVPWCYCGLPEGVWMPRADVLLTMKLSTEATARWARHQPTEGGGPMWG